MAFATKYRIEFADVDGEIYRADIKYDGYANAVIVLDGTGEPCIIEYESTDDKLNPINGSGCTLNFYNNGSIDVTDFFAVGMYSIVVEVEKQMLVPNRGLEYHRIWAGYVNAELLDEDYSTDDGAITITANDGLACMKREKFFRNYDIGLDGLVIMPWELGLWDLTRVIARCIDKTFINRIYTIVDTNGNSSLFKNLQVDLSNYVDEDDESMTKREVLESILTPLTLRMFVFGNACWIVDPVLFVRWVSQVGYKAYNKFFIAAVGDEYYAFNFDINTGDVSFDGGDQRMSRIGGFATVVSNYSAYPDQKKIIPFGPESIAIDPEAVYGYSDYVADGGVDDLVGGWFKLIGTTQSYQQYGVTFGTYGFLTKWVEKTGPTDLPTSDEGKPCFGIYDSSYFDWDTTKTDPTEHAIVINGGWLAKNDEKITLKFNVRVQTRRVTNLVAHVIEIPMQIKVGDKWARMGENETTWYDVETIQWVSVDARKLFSDKEGVRKDLPFQVWFKNIPEAGFMQIIFGRETRMMNIGDEITYLDYASNQYTDTFISDFKILVNDKDIVKVEPEYKAESGVDFINNKKIELNHGSKRSNGPLDRAAFINESGEHEELFNRTSVDDSGSIAKILSKAYLNNFSQPYRKLTATLYVNCDMLRNSNLLEEDEDTPLNISGVFTPISILRYIYHTGSAKFMFVGGSINLAAKTVTGTWDEIFDADYTITKL